MQHLLCFNVDPQIISIGLAVVAWWLVPTSLQRAMAGGVSVPNLLLVTEFTKPKKNCMFHAIDKSGGRAQGIHIRVCVRIGFDHIYRNAPIVERDVVCAREAQREG